MNKICSVILLLVTSISAQCPWQQEVPDLQTFCVCAYNLRHELSVQCDAVDFNRLLRTLDRFARSIQIDLLYVNNSSIRTLANGSFLNVKILSLQLSGCRVRTVATSAFRGLEATLRQLHLQDNQLDEIPTDAIRSLRNLTQLDLSKNNITLVPDDAFGSLKSLATVKLAENNLTLSRYSFRGLESSLKNLNLRATRQKIVPECLENMRSLAFLDLSQNSLADVLSQQPFRGLESLTALNLERNLIQALAPNVFFPVRNTLSSLSLLNNLLTEFPTAAIGQLVELRVLDIGFNLITALPNNAFIGTPSLTLLALDGNPMETIPGEALAHLNTTLRGLSVGGHFLKCDCRLKWLTQWIKQGDLQVTSRERNPQFCAHPPNLKQMNFYKIKNEDLVCDSESSTPSIESIIEDLEPELGVGVGYVEPVPPTTIKPPQPSTSTNRVFIPTIRHTTKKAIPLTISTATQSSTTMSTTTTTTSTQQPSTTIAAERLNQGVGTHTTKRTVPVRSTTSHRPNIIQRPMEGARQAEDVIVRGAHRQDNSVIIQWDSDTSNIIGFRVVYRLFGDRNFKQGPPLEASEREFKIKNVPSQECIVVCVVTMEDNNVTPDTVPHSQCREVRTVVSSTYNMDRITIAASAAICGTVLLAVIIFIVASRRRNRELDGLQPTKSGGMPVVGSCCPADPHTSLATLNGFGTRKDWDGQSVYSSRSLNRTSRALSLYHIDSDGNEVGHCHMPMPHYSGTSTKPSKTRSIADGQSQNSLSNHSGHYTHGYSGATLSIRPELRASRQSLAGSERMSRLSYPVISNGHIPTSSRARTRPRSRNHREGSRYSTTGSNYCGETSDNNWGEDIYMARNATRNNGSLVPL